MKTNFIYYLINKTPPNFKFNKTLPLNILQHINLARSKNVKDSLFAWNLINEYSGFDLSNVKFLSSNKPIMDGGCFSISHSKGYVAVCFSSKEFNLGIDLEKIEDRNLDFLSKISPKFDVDDNTLKYNLWTEHEATAKALNLNILKDFKSKFKGITKTIVTSDGDFSLSIYNDSNLEIKEIFYENNV